MRRLAALLALCAVLFGVTACGGDKASTDVDTASNGDSAAVGSDEGSSSDSEKPDKPKMKVVDSPECDAFTALNYAQVGFKVANKDGDTAKMTSLTAASATAGATIKTAWPELAGAIDIRIDQMTKLTAGTALTPEEQTAAQQASTELGTAYNDKCKVPA